MLITFWCSRKKGVMDRKPGMKSMMPNSRVKSENSIPPAVVLSYAPKAQVPG